MFMAHIHIILHSYYTNIAYCLYIYNEVLSCICKINMKKIETILVITEKCQMLQRKILSFSNLSLFESETIFSRKIISKS